MRLPEYVYNHGMGKAIRATKRVIICLIGFPLLGLGIILIPLPGPGLLVSFLALIILSAEFDWAKNRLMTAKIKIKEIYQEAKDRADKIEHLSDKNK